MRKSEFYLSFAKFSSLEKYGLYDSMLALVVLLIIIVILYYFRCVCRDLLINVSARF